ncbi:MAG: non-hydrolyzing UDP-N-acetylglucosamine 2-epimerase [Pseudonocardiaceae bacterium]
MSAQRPIKVVTIMGTRPEMIRLSRVIARLDRMTVHIVVHTGQNYDYELNEIFFDDLGLRRPDHFLNVATSSLGATLGDILVKVEGVLERERPHAVLVLGDTNSCISAVMARRMRIPVYHLEAGNRCFDANVPEEVNRRMVDHVADYNLVYTEHARRNLLGEGIHPSRIMLTGSPMREVLDHHQKAISNSAALSRQGFIPDEYLLASLHREENVDDPARFSSLLRALRALGTEYGLPVLVSTHPRTRKRLEHQPPELTEKLILHPPFRFTDYVRLQQSARVVLSDSGTISEESIMLGFPAVTLRDSIERPEAVDSGGIVCTGVDVDAIVDAVAIVLDQYQHEGRPAIPAEYSVPDTSRRVVNFIRSTVHNRRLREASL